ncbi:MAG: hypothetical protein Tsb0013_03810 [Phycisphaerales bacterium]
MHDHDNAPDPDAPTASAPSDTSVGDRHAYWQANIRYVLILLSIWFAVSYGCGILFVEQLNTVRLPGSGFKLGFWFAQQGSIYTFVVLIAVYVWLMNRLDKRFGVQED